jgi:YVTN family beta-propeller protein
MRLTRLACAVAFGLACHSALAATAYVTNEKDDSISVIDLDSLEVTATLDVGMRPRGLLLSSDNKLLYICASDSDRVQVMTWPRARSSRSCPPGPTPSSSPCTPTTAGCTSPTRTMRWSRWSTPSADEVLAQIDVGVEPEGMAVSPDGKWAVNTSETTNMLHWIDTSTPAAGRQHPVDQRPRHVEFDKDGKRLWASAEIGGTVTVLDVDSRPGAQGAQVHHQGRTPGQGAASGRQAERRRQVRLHRSRPGQPCGRGGRQDLRDSRLPAGGAGASGTWRSPPDQKRLLTTNGVSGDVSVIDVDSLKVTKSIKVGRYPGAWW